MTRPVLTSVVAFAALVVVGHEPLAGFAVIEGVLEPVRGTPNGLWQGEVTLHEAIIHGGRRRAGRACARRTKSSSFEEP
jgi:hypothetical protein